MLRVHALHAGALPALTHLDLSANQLGAAEPPLPTSLTRLTALTHLDLSGNSLTELPHNMGLLRSLVTVKVSWCGHCTCIIMHGKGAHAPRPSGNSLTELPTAWASYGAW